MQYEAAKVTRKTWRRVAKNETDLAVSYKSKKTAAVIGKGTVGAGWATAPATMYQGAYSYQRLISN